MSRKPLIGVTTSFETNHETDPPQDRATLRAAYSDAVFAAGGIPFPLPTLAEPTDAGVDELLDRCDGLVLIGGDDLNPGHYGQSPHPRTKEMHPRRDAFEIVVARRADARRLPTFALCLGFQIMHVVRGGSLIQHVDDVAREPNLTHYRPRDANAYHSIRAAPESHLAKIVGNTEFESNSRHHQIVDPEQLGKGLTTVAWAPDGVIEASEDFDDRFLLAVQWHPEDLIDRPEHLRLFEALVDAAQVIAE